MDGIQPHRDLMYTCPNLTIYWPRMGGWMDRWMAGQMDGWTDGEAKNYMPRSMDARAKTIWEKEKMLVTSIF